MFCDKCWCEPCVCETGAGSQSAPKAGSVPCRIYPHLNSEDVCIACLGCRNVYKCQEENDTDESFERSGNGQCD